MRFSFLIICYNQEQYIADAINSALSQDWDNLELIISDDNSSDRTYEIATTIVNNYKGPHKIILNKNKANIGIGGNFNKAYSLSSGEWLFMAAGDDISNPDRCKTTWETIQQYPQMLGLGAIREIIDQDTNTLGYCTWGNVIHGASAAWNRKLFSSFPPIPNSNMSEDLTLFFRIFLLGGTAVQLYKPLIKYRVDGRSVSNQLATDIVSEKKDILKKKKYWKDILKTYYTDCKHFESNLNTSDIDRFYKFIKKEELLAEQQIFDLEYFLGLIGANLSSKIKYLFKAKPVGLHKKFKYRIFTILISCNFGYKLYHYFVYPRILKKRQKYTSYYKELKAYEMIKEDVITGNIF